MSLILCLSVCLAVSSLSFSMLPLRAGTVFTQLSRFPPATLGLFHCAALHLLFLSALPAHLTVSVRVALAGLPALQAFRAVLSFPAILPFLHPDLLPAKDVLACICSLFLSILCKFEFVYDVYP